MLDFTSLPSTHRELSDLTCHPASRRERAALPIIVRRPQAERLPEDRAALGSPPPLGDSP
eukprot:3484706-Pyramimonas_sp.AAC.1